MLGEPIHNLRQRTFSPSPLVPLHPLMLRRTPLKLQLLARTDFIGRLQRGRPQSFFDLNRSYSIENTATLRFISSLSQCLEKPIGLKELMKHCLLPATPSLGISDGLFATINKATILHYLLKNVAADEAQYPTDHGCKVYPRRYGATPCSYGSVSHLW